MKYHWALKAIEKSETCYTTNKPWGDYAKWNKPVTKGKLLDSTLAEVPRVVKSIETASRMAVAGERGGMSGGVLFSGCSFPLGRWKGSGNGWCDGFIMRMCLVPGNCTFKKVKMAHFMLYILSTIERKIERNTHVSVSELLVSERGNRSETSHVIFKSLSLSHREDYQFLNSCRKEIDP